MSARPTAVIAGALANRPGNGGGASVRTTWAATLARLGYEVWFIEQIPRRALSDAEGRPSPPEESVELDYFRKIMRQSGLTQRSALVDEVGTVLEGRDRATIDKVAARAEFLLNLGGHLALPEILDRFRNRVYLDLDPGYTQLWHVLGEGAARLAGHHHYFTVGLNVGLPVCSLPTGSIAWQPLPPPVLLDEWEPFDGRQTFTTVATWRGPFGRPEHRGRQLGLKAHEFRKVIAIPRLAPAEFEIALDIHDSDRSDRDALLSHGWRLVDPRRVAADPESYRDYIRGSGAEFSVAQGIFVESVSGWISDRTVRYLAAGKPALVQDTGLGEQIPVGEGLMVFQTLDQAVAGAAQIAAEYRRHSVAARRIAVDRFDAGRVGAELLARIGLRPEVAA